MSRHILQRMAKAYGWQPEEWHLKLADSISPVAVIAIFRECKVTELRSGAKQLFFDVRDQMVTARGYEKQVEAAMGCKVVFDGPAFYVPPKRTNIIQNNKRGE